MLDTQARPQPTGLPPAYVKDKTLNLYRRAGFSGLRYSDGAESERRILEAVRGARDLGTFSSELTRAITDWPSEYHLSRQRHCVVRPLGIQPGDRVLELGCGCGAITRYLGEIGAEVTALEGASPRGQIAAERCRDLPNVTVIVDDLLRFPTDEQFDWVLMVGVLEYAPVYSQEADPVAHVLRRAAGHLNARGRLVVAIENKLGLKYFNGCAEDHVGIPFHGPQGLYDERAPRTFGRRELAGYIGGAGLPHIAFSYPFPDYKLPRVVLAEAALTDPDFDAAGTLAYVQARDYGGNTRRLFDEALVARELARNGLLGDMSNSFLVVAAAQDWTRDAALALAFSAQRNAEFAAQTRFVRDGGTIRVEKRRLFPEREGRRRFADGSALENVAGDTVYAPGALAITAVNAARARRGDLAAIVEALASWFDFLLARAEPSAGSRLSDFALPGSYLDVTPFNLVETREGLVPIDMEWRVDRTIPLGWVVTRSVVHSLWGIAGFERTAVSVADVVGALCARHRLAVSGEEISAWFARESELQGLSSGRLLPDYAGGLMSRQLVPPEYVTGQEARIGTLTQSVAELETHIAQIHQSRSWRYSYPIRAIGRLLRGEADEPPPAAAKPGAASAAGRPAAARTGFVSSLSGLFGGLRGPPWPDLTRYGWAVLAVLVTFVLTQFLLSHGVHVPRMLLYIAAVAIAARVGGLGPGVFAIFASVLAICLSAPSIYEFAHKFVTMERLGIFLLCAIIGILVSTPPEPEERRHP